MLKNSKISRKIFTIFILSNGNAVTPGKTKEMNLLNDLILGLDEKGVKKYGFKCIQDLKKFGLIEKDAAGVYALTSKGKAVGKQNIRDYISYKKTEEYLLSYSYEKSKRENFIIALVGLIVILVLIFLLFMPEGRKLLE